jgi:hypothetical protein
LSYEEFEAIRITKSQTLLAIGVTTLVAYKKSHNRQNCSLSVKKGTKGMTLDEVKARIERQAHAWIAQDIEERK